MSSRGLQLALLPSLLIGVSLAAPLLPLEAQQRGSVVGVVRDSRNGEPVEGAEVVLVGTDLRVTVNEVGEFMFPDVPAGTLSVRVERAGYTGLLEQIELAPEGVADVEVHLQPIAVLLEELLVRGRREQRERGYAVAEVRTNRTVGFTAADLLAASVAGLSVMIDRGGQGGGASVTIRGIGSITQSDAPLIFLDGILISQPLSRNDPAPTILRQIPAREVARIRVLRGPAATALYANAANGVILIETVHAVSDLPFGG
jgi:hypothetical protein